MTNDETKTTPQIPESQFLIDDARFQAALIVRRLDNLRGTISTAAEHQQEEDHPELSSTLTALLNLEGQAMLLEVAMKELVKGLEDALPRTDEP